MSIKSIKNLKDQIGEELFDELKDKIEPYLSHDSDDDECDDHYGPLFGYLYIRDFLHDDIAPKLKDENLLKLINELNLIINGEDERFNDTYTSTMEAVERCDEILEEINDIMDEDHDCEEE